MRAPSVVRRLISAFISAFSLNAASYSFALLTDRRLGLVLSAQALQFGVGHAPLLGGYRELWIVGGGLQDVNKPSLVDALAALGQILLRQLLHLVDVERFVDSLDSKVCLPCRSSQLLRLVFVDQFGRRHVDGFVLIHLRVAIGNVR